MWKKKQPITILLISKIVLCFLSKISNQDDKILIYCTGIIIFSLEGK